MTARRITEEQARAHAEYWAQYAASGRYISPTERLVGDACADWLDLTRELAERDKRIEELTGPGSPSARFNATFKAWAEIVGEDTPREAINSMEAPEVRLLERTRQLAAARGRVDYEAARREIDAARSCLPSLKSIGTLADNWTDAGEAELADALMGVRDALDAADAALRAADGAKCERCGLPLDPRPDLGQNEECICDDDPPAARHSADDTFAPATDEPTFVGLQPPAARPVGCPREWRDIYDGPDDYSRAGSPFAVEDVRLVRDSGPWVRTQLDGYTFGVTHRKGFVARIEACEALVRIANGIAACEGEGK